MSVLSSSEASSLSSEDIPHRSVDDLSRLHIQLSIEQPCAAHIASEVVRLMERFMPDIPHFMTFGGNALVIRVRHSALTVCQTDLFVTRLARTRGVSFVHAEQKLASEGAVYAAELRGRSRTVRVQG